MSIPTRQSPPRSPYLNGISDPSGLFVNPAPFSFEDALNIYDFAKIISQDHSKAISVSSESTNLLLQGQDTETDPSSSFFVQATLSDFYDTTVRHHESDEKQVIIKIELPKNPPIHEGDIFPSSNLDNFSPNDDCQNHDDQTDVSEVEESPEASSEEVKPFKAVDVAILIPSMDSTASSLASPQLSNDPFDQNSNVQGSLNQDCSLAAQDNPQSPSFTDELLNLRPEEDFLDYHEPWAKKIKKDGYSVFKIIKTVRNIIKQHGNDEEKRQIATASAKKSEVDNMSRGTTKTRKSTKTVISKEEQQMQSILDLHNQTCKKTSQTLSKNWPVLILRRVLRSIEAYEDGERWDQTRYMGSIFGDYCVGELKEMTKRIKGALKDNKGYKEVFRTLFEYGSVSRTAGEDVVKAIVMFLGDEGEKDFNDWDFMQDVREKESEERIQREKEDVRDNFVSKSLGNELKTGRRATSGKITRRVGTDCQEVQFQSQ